jgi:uncharacterized membrane protein
MTTATPVFPSITADSLVEKPRIASIDIMRGIVMVIMALDHTRDFFHADVALFDPTDLTKTNPILFFTRLITHYCAPTFVFLSGVSAYISRQRKTAKELSLFLFTRGLWLIVLEFTVVRFGIIFNLYYDFIIFQVIWVIGASMIVLAAFVHFSPKVILGIGLVLVFGQNLLDVVQLAPGQPGHFWWAIIHQAGIVPLGTERICLAAYPLIPWLGIMLTGYGTGFLYHKNFDPAIRKKVLVYAGILAILLFVVIRYTNWYGDPSPWSPQKNSIFTLMSFVNVTKYPVSLLYTLMTLGPVLIILAWMENLKTNLLEPMRIIGRVPLFYYILHFYLIHVTALCLYMITTGTSWSEIDFHFSKGFGGIPRGIGYTLGWVYVAWISIVIALYPLCKWYHQYKSTHNRWWLGYL